jgi:uncharacterized protein
MLELRPNCECCDKDLPPNAGDAMICTYECTFCAACVANVLGGRCPNCHGGFAPRPIRPPGRALIDPPSTTRVHGSDPRCAAAALARDYLREARASGAPSGGSNGSGISGAS